MKEPRTRAGLLLAVSPVASGDADTVLAALRQVHQLAVGHGVHGVVGTRRGTQFDQHRPPALDQRALAALPVTTLADDQIAHWPYSMCRHATKVALQATASVTANTA